MEYLNVALKKIPIPEKKAPGMIPDDDPLMLRIKTLLGLSDAYN